MKQLQIKNFKCFSNKTIDLNDLTLLVGANGVGKSSVIQALLLLRSSIEKKMQQGDNIALNDYYGLMLGTSEDVISQSKSESMISLNFKQDETNNVGYKYIIDDISSKLYLTVDEVSDNGSTIISDNQFYYLSAERLGPRISQPLHYLPELNVGIYGQHTAQVLSSTKDAQFKVMEERMCEGTKIRILVDQTNFWLSKMMPGIEISAVLDTVSLQAQIKIKDHKNDFMLAPNIGFGISYLLPIIVTGLIAKPGAMFIVENPEAHLHPAAQSAIGEFLGMVANTGVNVIVETHSDHVVNGVQIYVAEHKEFADKVVINNFSQSEDDNQPNIDALTINENGELSDWPKGFFDQSQIDFMRLHNIKL